MLQELINEIHQKERDQLSDKIEQIYEYFQSKRFRLGDLTFKTLYQILEIIEEEKNFELKQKMIEDKAKFKFKIDAEEFVRFQEFSNLNNFL